MISGGESSRTGSSRVRITIDVRSVSLDRPCNSDLLVRFLIEPIRCEFKFFGSGTVEVWR